MSHILLATITYIYIFCDYSLTREMLKVLTWRFITHSTTLCVIHNTNKVKTEVVISIIKLSTYSEKH